MDSFLGDDGSDTEEEEWRLDTSIENCIIHHVHCYGELYKDGRMKNDDIFSMAATIFNQSEAPVIPLEGIFSAHDMAGAWKLSLSDQHAYVLIVGSCVRPGVVRVSAFEWYQHQRVHSEVLEMTLEHRVSDEALSIRDSVRHSTSVSFCTVSSVYGKMRCAASILRAGTAVCWRDIAVTNAMGQSICVSEMERVMGECCAECGNTSEAEMDRSKEHTEGVIACMHCGTCIVDNIDNGEAFRKFEGEKDRNHHGKWNELFSSSYNLRTFQSSRKRKSGSASTNRQCDSYKDKQKKEAFDIIDAMSHTSEHQYAHGAAKKSACHVRFPTLSIQTISQAKITFANMRDRGERITHFVSIVASCLIAAYWKMDAGLEAPPASIMPATLHKKRPKPSRDVSSDEQAMWQMCSPTLRSCCEMVTTETRTDRCSVCSLFDDRDTAATAGDEEVFLLQQEAEQQHVPSPKQGLNSHLPRDHPMWCASAASHGAPSSAPSGDTSVLEECDILEMTKKRLPPSIHKTECPAGVLDLLSPYLNHFLSNEESYVLQWIIRNTFLAEGPAYPQELVNVGGSHISDSKKRSLFVRSVLVKLWSYRLIERQIRAVHCDICMEFGIAKNMWVVADEATLRKTVIPAHYKAIMGLFEHRAVPEGGGVAEMREVVLSRGECDAAGREVSCTTQQKARARMMCKRPPEPTKRMYTSVNPYFDLELPSGWAYVARPHRGELCVMYRHQVSGAAQWDPPPMVARHPDTRREIQAGLHGVFTLPALRGEWRQCVEPLHQRVGFRHTQTGQWRWQPPPHWPPLPQGWAILWDAGLSALSYVDHNKAAPAAQQAFPVRHPIGQPMPVEPWIVYENGKMRTTAHTVRAPSVKDLIDRLHCRARKKRKIMEHDVTQDLPFSLQHAMRHIARWWAPRALEQRERVLGHLGRFATWARRGVESGSAGMSIAIAMRIAKVLLGVHMRISAERRAIERGELVSSLLQPQVDSAQDDGPSDDPERWVAVLRPHLHWHEHHALSTLACSSSRDEAVRAGHRWMVKTGSFHHTMSRYTPNREFGWRPGHRMHEYQRQVVSSVVGPHYCSSGIVVVPCGGGKTVIGIGILVRCGGCCMVLCNNSTSVRQWEEECLRWTDLQPSDICCISSDAKEALKPRRIAQCRVIISTYYMLMANTGKRQKHILNMTRKRRWDITLLDEVHMVGASKINKVVASIHSKIRVGLTATPLREDDAFKQLQFLIGPILCTVSWESLTRQGYLATIENVNVICPMHPDILKQYRERKHDILAKCISALNPNKIMACMSILRYHLARRHKILIFFEELFVMKQYALYLKDDKGMPLVKIESQERPEIIARATQQFRDGTIRVLCLSRTGDCSLNVPDANVAIEVSSHEKSRRQRAQRLGRISRKVHNVGRPVGSDDDYESYFYTLVSQDTKEMLDREHREKYLELQGYSFPTVQWTWHQAGAGGAAAVSSSGAAAESRRNRARRERMRAILHSIHPEDRKGNESAMMRSMDQALQQHIRQGGAPPSGGAQSRQRRKPGQATQRKTSSLRKRFMMTKKR